MSHKYLPSLTSAFIILNYTQISADVRSGWHPLFTPNGYGPPPNVRLTRQKVHKDLPGILKEYTKAIIRSSLRNEEDLIKFSFEYFKEKYEESTNALVGDAQ